MRDILDAGVKSFFNKEPAKKTDTFIKIKYAKEFFINEKGEVIKMAAIVTQDP